MLLPFLDRASPTPLYHQIIDWMREQILGGIWPEHYQLKSEIDLAAELNVNRGTLRNAIKALIDEGLLMRIHGKGTFVAAATLEQPLAESLITFSEGLIAQRIPFQTRVLSTSIIHPDPSLASLLNLKPEDSVFALRRLRYVKGKPLIVLNNFVVYRYCPGIETVDFDQNSLFETLEGRFGLRLDWGRRFFEAQAASDTIAELLEVDACAPVMYTRQIVYLEDSQPVELSDLWIRGDHFRVSAVVKRHSRKSLVTTIQQYRQDE